MVFTVVTLLFVFQPLPVLSNLCINESQLPMSFLTSFFALDAESFLKTPAWAFIVICKSPELNIDTTVFLIPA